MLLFGGWCEPFPGDFSTNKCCMSSENIVIARSSCGEVKSRQKLASRQG
jgi:hypothetical protein